MAEAAESTTFEDGVEEDSQDTPTQEEKGSEETPEKEAEEDPEQAEERQKKEAQDAVQKAINKQHRKYREEERKRIAVEKELEELKAKMSTGQEGRPVIPPMPEPFQSDYNEKLRERDDAIKKAAVWEIEQARKQESQQKEQKTVEQRAAQETQELLQTFDENAVKAKIDPAEIKQAADIVATYGLHPDVVRFMLSDKDGPAIVHYLGNHPVEIDSLTDLPPMHAAIHLKTNVLPKAVEARARTVSNAPPPTQIRKGSTVGEKEPLLKGVTFE